ncbi:hypothetical protein [Mycolicibacterium brumae]|uniref:hypothetical protein n=1 Tax=Mycolicibacterium brumae TaxID=85968 RepID=UPI000A9E80A3|nr:hypothetical protein [Mycolicibacterium brumae]UWW07642.1 hypothetical protein L2Z93_000667 [Mycolicibacterium brumae]
MPDSTASPNPDSGSDSGSGSGEHTRILRRAPAQAAEEPSERGSDGTGSETRIIRRAPTGAIPVVPAEVAAARSSLVEPSGNVAEGPSLARSSLVEPSGDVAEGPSLTRSSLVEPSGLTAQAAAVTAMLSGWPTSVVATNLIAGWWDGDQLFCVAIGFLTCVFAAATIVGVLFTLRRRSWGPYLLTAGAVIALLMFAGVFVAGARLEAVVYAVPALPLATVILALLPSTRRWAAG